MNNAHVAALAYRISDGNQTDYSTAQPLGVDEPTSHLEINAGGVRH